MSAPVTLITGTPGAGKTLFAIDDTRKRAASEGRQVYYFGIDDLRLPWIAIGDPERWFEAPSGSIIVLDEAQRLFRPRGIGAGVPPFVSALETLRHSGHDIVLITQHPMLIDANVRRLVGRHVHVARRFGMQRATVLEFPTVREQPTRAAADAVRKSWSYPRDVFELYKSAEVHTIKRRIPAKAWLLLVLPVLIVALFYWEYVRVRGRVEAPKREAVGVVASAAGQSAAVVPASGGRAPALTLPEYLSAAVPRVRDLASSAPRYDELTKPVRAPVPAACYSLGNRCRCFSQQGTLLDTSLEFCRQVVRYGYFEDFEREVRSDDRLPRRPRERADAALDAVAAATGQEVSASEPEALSWPISRFDGRQTARRPM